MVYRSIVSSWSRCSMTWNPSLQSELFRKQAGTRTVENIGTRGERGNWTPILILTWLLYHYSIVPRNMLLWDDLVSRKAVSSSLGIWGKLASGAREREERMPSMFALWGKKGPKYGNRLKVDHQDIAETFLPFTFQPHVTHRTSSAVVMNNDPLHYHLFVIVTQNM